MEDREKKLGNYYGHHGGNYAGTVFDKDYLCPALSTMGGGNQQPMIIEEQENTTECEFYKKAIYTAIKEKAQPGDVVDAFNGKVRKDGICPTITTRPEGEKTAILPCVEAVTTRGSDIVSTIRSSYYKNGERNITENCKKGMGYEGVVQGYRIRKLTPRECWRLMGYSDSDFDKAQKVNSNTQLYRQAGNAIVKQVLMAIFKQMGA